MADVMTYEVTQSVIEKWAPDFDSVICVAWKAAMCSKRQKYLKFEDWLASIEPEIYQILKWLDPISNYTPISTTH